MPRPKNKKPNTDLWLLLAVVLSGAAALGYEMMWTRLLSLVVGGELLGILGVLVGFFGGMAIGAFALSKRAAQTKSPLKVFFLLEGAIALYGSISPYLIHFMSELVPAWIGSGSSDSGTLGSLLIIILCTGVILLPATIGMGANFAFLVEARRRYFARQANEKGLARIYAANTFGAVLGIFLSIYIVMPAVGFSGAAVVFSLLGAAAIFFAFRWQKDHSTSAKPKQLKTKTTEQKSAVFPLRNQYLLLLFGTGFLGIGLEILVVHHFKQILENTIFSFGNILAIYLLGTAIGAWLFQRYYHKKMDQAPTLLMAGLATSVLYTSILLSYAGELLVFFSPDSTAYLGHLRAELLLAIVVFLLPTLFMGALFSYLIAKMKPAEVGLAYGMNTAGAVFAPFLFGLVLIPRLGGQLALILCWVAYALLLLWGMIGLKWKGRPVILGVVNAVLLILLINKGVNLLKTEPGYELVQKIEGLMGVVAVSDKGTREGPYQLPARILQVNNEFRMGGGASFLERRMGNLPLLMANQYDNALFLGIGTGSTMGVIADYPFQEVEAVEIVREVKEVLPWFDEHNLSVLQDNRLKFHLADARRFINSTQNTYDFILVDLFHPARDGAGLLFSQENFALLRARLSDDGLLAYWLPVHQFDPEGLKLVVRTFLSVFPEGHAILGSYSLNTPVIALLASPKPLSVDLSSAAQQITQHLNVQLAVENAEDLAATYLMNGQQLAAYAGEGPLNSDLFPRLLFHAPKATYTPNAEKAAVNIQELRQYRTAFPNDIFKFNNSASGVQARKAWQAAGIFLEGNEAIRQGNNPKALQDYIRAYKVDPSFSPSRGQLFQYALGNPDMYSTINQALHPSDRERLRLIQQETQYNSTRRPNQ
ncbi:MAG: MFS transporter [Bacteroidota bacterium]